MFFFYFFTSFHYLIYSFKQVGLKGIYELLKHCLILRPNNSENQIKNGEETMYIILGNIYHINVNNTADILQLQTTCGFGMKIG